MFTFIKYTIKEIMGLTNDYESLLSNQDLILQKLEKLEQLEVQNQSQSYYDYLTFKNLLYLLIILSLAGGGFWLYSNNIFNNSILDSIKSLGTLSKDLNEIHLKSILEAFNKLNENSVNLSKEEIKLLLQIKNLLLKKGIDENSDLDKPLSDILQPNNGGITWDDES